MFKMNLKNIVYLLTLLVSTNVLALEFQGKFIQGHFILGKTDPGSKIIIDKKKVKIIDYGYFVFGIGRDRKYDISITKELNGSTKRIVKKVLKENIKFKELMVSWKNYSSKRSLWENKRENKIIGEARAVESNLTFFKNKFISPLDKAIVTGVYGSQRILNGKPKWPHYGIDFG